MTQPRNDRLAQRIRAARRAMYRMEDAGDLEGKHAIRDLIRTAESQRKAIVDMREGRFG
jgi:hypothetical protein